MPMAEKSYVKRFRPSFIERRKRSVAIYADVQVCNSFFLSNASATWPYQRKNTSPWLLWAWVFTEPVRRTGVKESSSCSNGSHES